jgi:hypothetical protein
LRQGGGVVKRGFPNLGLGVHMSGILMILVFLGVMAALNRFEFGRFD